MTDSSEKRQEASKERCGIVGCVLDKGHPGSVHNTTAALVEMARACAIDLRRVGRPTAADGVEAIAKEVERLKYELEVQKGVVDFAYIPHRNLVEQRDRADSDFKNFHRLLCARFGYGHDEKDWRRDQLSLIEWIANRPTNETLNGLPSVNRELSDALTELYRWAGSSQSKVEALPYTLGQKVRAALTVDEEWEKAKDAMTGTTPKALEQLTPAAVDDKLKELRRRMLTPDAPESGGEGE